MFDVRLNGGLALNSLVPLEAEGLMGTSKKKNYTTKV
jgi:hypothetical protein